MDTRAAVSPGVYTTSIRLFRCGEEYTEHRVLRLILGKNGSAYARIDQPGRSGIWESMNLAGPWSDTGKMQAGDAVIKLHDSCATHFMLPTGAHPTPLSPEEEALVAGIRSNSTAQAAP